jgi:hypothetical protein
MNRLSLTVGLAVMDTCWLAPWSVLLGLWAEPGRLTGLLGAPIILAVLLVSAFATHRLGPTARGHPRRARVVLAALAVLAAIIAVRLEHYPSASGLEWIGPMLGALAATIGQLSLPVLGFALGLYLWWRGVRLGSQTPGLAEVEGAFRWGIGRLAVFGLVMAISTRPTVLPGMEAATTPYVVAFFFTALLTLALGRLESLRTRTRAPSLNTQWLAVLIVVAAGVVLLALLLGQLVSFDVLIVATRPLFDLLGNILLLLLYAIVIPLSFVIEWLVYLVLSLVSFNTNRPPPQPPESSDINQLLQRFLAEQVPPELLIALKALGAAVLVAVALIVVARGLARWRPTSADADATNEERDSLWRAEEVWARLLAWLRRLLRREPVVMPVLDAVAQPTSSRSESAGGVRALYARLLQRGEAAGAQRAAGTTPLEHMPALEQALTPETTVIELTDAYVHIRYGDEREDPATVDGLAEQLAAVEPIHAVE